MTNYADETAFLRQQAARNIRTRLRRNAAAITLPLHIFLYMLIIRSPVVTYTLDQNTTKVFVVTWSIALVIHICWVIVRAVWELFLRLEMRRIKQSDAYTRATIGLTTSTDYPKAKRISRLTSDGEIEEADDFSEDAIQNVEPRQKRTQSRKA